MPDWRLFILFFSGKIFNYSKFICNLCVSIAFCHYHIWIELAILWILWPSENGRSIPYIRCRLNRINTCVRCIAKPYKQWGTAIVYICIAHTRPHWCRQNFAHRRVRLTLLINIQSVLQVNAAFACMKNIICMWIAITITCGEIIECYYYVSITCLCPRDGEKVDYHVHVQELLRGHVVSLFLFDGAKQIMNK